MLAGKGITMINAAGWHLRLNISSSLGKDLQLMDAGSEEQIFFLLGTPVIYQ